MTARRSVRQRPKAAAGLTSIHAFHAHILEHVHDAVLATDERFNITVWNLAAEKMYGWKAAEVIGRRLHDIVRSDFSAEQRTEALRQLDETGRFQAELIEYRRDGTPFHVAGQTIALRNAAGRITGYISANRDVTAQKQAEEVSRRQAARAHLLADISKAFAEAGLDQAVVVRTVVERTAELIGDGSNLYLSPKDPDSRPTIVFHHSKPAGLAAMRDLYSRWNGRVTPLMGRVLAGEVVLLPTPSLGAIRTVVSAETRPYLERVGIGSLLLLPLRVREQVIGMLSLTRDETGAPYTHEDQIFLQEIADRAALTIENARLFQSASEQRRQLSLLSARLVDAQESERRAVARELHDEVGQLLASLKFIAEARERGGSSVPAAGVIETTTRLLERIRNLSLSLRPPMLDDMGLVPTLLWYFERYQSATGVTVHFHHSDTTERLPASTEVSIFRVIQEALTNVARHAAATEAYVDVRTDNGVLCVRIEDAGKGFDSAPSRTSAGVHGMRERATLLGGTLTIESRPGAGTRLVMSLPLAPAEPREGS